MVSMILTSFAQGSQNQNIVTQKISQKSSIPNPQCSGSGKDACLRCGFHSETVQLLYWDVDEVDEWFLCKAGNTTDDHEESKKFLEKRSISNRVMTAQCGSFTLTSPTVHAYYTTIQDKWGCGTKHTNV
jgi:hypothetical protein